MLRSLSRLLATAAVLAGLSAVGFAQTKERLITPQVGGGLQLSLDTNGFQFNPTAPNFPPNARESRDRVAWWYGRAVIASVQLTNRSPYNVEVEFPNQVALDQKFNFRVINSAGETVWSNAGTPNVAPVTGTLGRKGKWRATQSIPLFLDGVPLPTGRYTLEAKLAGEPSVSATTLFQVVSEDQLVPVWSVSEVSVRPLQTLRPPAMLQVKAEGMVTTGGWTNPTLRYRGTTADGIAEFDFVAKEPDGFVTQALEPVTATATLEHETAIRGVRVYTKTNSKEAFAF